MGAKFMGFGEGAAQPICKPALIAAGHQSQRPPPDLPIVATAIEHQLMRTTRKVCDFPGGGVQAVNPLNRKPAEFGAAAGGKEGPLTQQHWFWQPVQGVERVPRHGYGRPCIFKFSQHSKAQQTIGDPTPILSMVRW